MPCGQPSQRRATVAGQPITFELHRSAKRRKSITIHVEGDRLRVLAPKRTPLQHIDELIKQREQWIVERIAIRRASGLRAELKEGGQIPLLGSRYPVVVDRDLFLFAFIRQQFFIDDTDPRVYAAAEQWFRKFAYEEFSDRIDQWSPRVGASPAKIQVRNQKTRWGSASSNGTLSLNWRLMFAESELVDYVVVHELCHLIQPNHSAAYWQLVESIMPDYREKRQALKDASDDLVW